MRYWRIGVLLCLIMICLFFLAILIKSKQERRPTLETPNTEVQTLPLEVVAKIGKAESDESIRVPILMYHYVEYVKDTNDTIRQSLNITPDIFEAQVQALANAGYTFLTMKELGQIIDEQKKPPPKPIVLTFDDGHWDVYTDILPILQKYQAKATVYIITDFLEGSDFLSYQQVRQLIDSKLVEIGSHTVHHAYLAERLPMTLKYELEESKKMLEETFNIWVYSFAYPNGALDLAAMEAVRRAGYTTATSTVPGVYANKANRFALYRLRPGRRTNEALIDYLGQDHFTAF